MKIAHSLLSCAALLACAPAAVLAQAAASGEVMFVSGKAERFKADGSSAPVSKGLQLAEGDKIKTQADSHVYVRLRDGGLLVVRPSSELNVDLWRFDPARPQDSRIRYTLDNGAARHVSGEAAKAARDKFRFNTPMAAIGVRGTDFTVLAEPSATRVSVQTGGVIVSSLGNGCRADALGPCNDGAAVELFAAQARDKQVQVRMGERRPEVIEGVAVAADRTRTGTTTAADQPSKPKNSTELELAEVRTTDFVEKATLQTQPKPAPVVIATAVAPEPPVAVWGRWAAIADKDPGVVKAEDILTGRTIVGINNLYILAANKMGTPMELPGSGIADFKLVGHEGVITDKATGVHHGTTASDATLRIDFGARRFETAMNVRAGEYAAEIGAKGSVEADGKFRNDAFVSKSIISGIVGGKNAAEAMYIYQSKINERFDATGAASWRK